MDKIYMVPVTGFVLIQARDRASAQMAFDSEFSDHPHMKVGDNGMSKVETQISVENLGCADSYPIDGYGMTIEEFLEY